MKKRRYSMLKRSLIQQGRHKGIIAAENKVRSIRLSSHFKSVKRLSSSTVKPILYDGERWSILDRYLWNGKLPEVE